MKLEKAIEYLTKFDNGEYSCDAVTFRKAVKLGNEALKRELDNRSGSKYVIVKPLKSETEE